jgi:uncharacterized protein YndB with AHSA1/START domain
MNDTDEKARAEHVLAFDLDAPPEKVWRAVTVPALRERWLPDSALADPEPISTIAGVQVRYRMRDDEPPFLESIVTFEVRPNDSGGATLRIIHRLAGTDDRRQALAAANSNRRRLMCAA